MDYGLPALTSFSQITTDPALQAKFASAYATIDDVEAWVGMIAEKHQRNALVGPTMIAVLKEQFVRLRDGDRFWYESYLDPANLQIVQKTKLADIIRRNTVITTELPNQVFRVPTPTPTPDTHLARGWDANYRCGSTPSNEGGQR